MPDLGNFAGLRGSGTVELDLGYACVCARAMRVSECERVRPNLHVFAEAGGVVVAHGFSITKGLQYLKRVCACVCGECVSAVCVRLCVCVVPGWNRGGSA